MSRSAGGVMRNGYERRIFAVDNTYIQPRLGCYPQAGRTRRGKAGQAPIKHSRSQSPFATDSAPHATHVGKSTASTAPCYTSSLHRRKKQQRAVRATSRGSLLLLGGGEGTGPTRPGRATRVGGGEAAGRSLRRAQHRSAPGPIPSQAKDASAIVPGGTRAHRRARR